MTKRWMALIGLASLASLAQPKMPAPLVAVEKVQERPLEYVQRYTGRVETPYQVEVVARVSEEIEERGFQDGDLVKKGQVLYKLRQRRYIAALKACEGRVLQCKGQLEEARAKELYAKNNYDRTLALYKKEVVSQDALESAKSVWDVAVASTQAAAGNLMEAEGNRVQAQTDFDDTTILATIDGKAGVSNKAVGNYVTPASGTLVTLLQTSPMRVRFALSMRDYLNCVGDDGKFAQQPKIEVCLGNGAVYSQQGSLELVDNQVNRNTDSLMLYAQFPNPSGILVHGATVTVNMTLASPKPMVAVTPSAVMHDTVSSYVYVVDGENKVSRRNVKLGLGTASWQYVEEGLKAGETVVKDGMHKVMPGMTVQCTEQDTIHVK